MYDKTSEQNKLDIKNLEVKMSDLQKIVSDVINNFEEHKAASSEQQLNLRFLNYTILLKKRINF